VVLCSKEAYTPFLHDDFTVYAGCVPYTRKETELLNRCQNAALVVTLRTVLLYEHNRNHGHICPVSVPNEKKASYHNHMESATSTLQSFISHIS